MKTFLTWFLYEKSWVYFVEIIPLSLYCGSFKKEPPWDKSLFTTLPKDPEYHAGHLILFTDFAQSLIIPCRHPDPSSANLSVVQALWCSMFAILFLYCMEGLFEAT